jgi:hypothetical protein
MRLDTSQVLFRHEYESELESWLRKRFAWLCGLTLVMACLRLAWKVGMLLGLDSAAASIGWLAAVTVAEGLASIAIAGAFYMRRERHATRDELLHAASQLIVALGVVSLASRFVSEWLGYPFSSSVIASIFLWHFGACLLLPWTPRDSLRPIVPLLAVWVAHTLVLQQDDLVVRVLAVLFSPGILLPGLVISAWRLRRHGREFRSTMLGRHVRDLRQELTRARRIHEGLFPREFDDGSVRFQYTYQPMRELGGDFLHAASGPEGRAHLMLLDVTGHGLAAALTVNRIYGEMERIRAESPHASPGEVLGLLNRYIALTMVKHNIFATAVCLTLDPDKGELRWASAGHPPVFLRGANGAIRQLDSTTLLLGAMGEDEFEPGEQSLELSPGDVVIAYTDGAIEARDRRGARYGIPRLQDLLRAKPAPVSWPQHIWSSIERHKAGKSEDDVLVAALTFAAPRAQRAAARPAMART